MDRDSLITFIKNKQFSIRVIANSNENSLKLEPGKGLILRLKAKAQDNKANLALMKYFKKEYRLKVSVLKGHKSRDKILCITH